MTISTPIEDAVAFEELLEQLRTMRAFDFTGYKRSSLLRDDVTRRKRDAAAGS